MSIPGSASPLFLSAAAAAADAPAGPIKSLRFNSGDTAYLSRTPSSTGNKKTFTVSFWIKKVKNDSSGNFYRIFGQAESTHIYFYQDNLHFDVSSSLSGSAIGRRWTRQVFRDNLAWFHCVCVCDTTASTASERMRMYINGVEVESFNSSYFTHPSQNADTTINTTNEHTIGYRTAAQNSAGGALDAYIADFYLIDGSALDATSFGAFDDSGVWQAAAYSGTFGTNGFHLLDFANEATVGHDSSGNENDFTANNITNETSTSLPAVFFDGTGDYLSVPDSDDFHLGTSEFTIECFIRKTANGSNNYDAAIATGSNGSYHDGFAFLTSSSDAAFRTSDGSTGYGLDFSSASFATDGKWHHIAVTRDGSNVARLFLDGVLQDTETWNFSIPNSSTPLYVGAQIVGGTTYSFNGFISNVRFIKGTAVYTSAFTTPTAPLSNVTNTKLLCCQSNSSATTAAVAPGTITANGDAYAVQFSDSSSDQDVLFDVPTNGTQSDTGAGGEVSGNYCTWNPLDSNSNHSLSNGNLDLGGYASAARTNGTISVSSGKWYFEVTNTDGWDYVMVGVGPAGTTGSYPGSDSTSWSFLADGNKYHNGSGTSVSPAGNSAGDIIGVALDLDNGKIYFSANGVYVGSGDPAAGSNPAYSSVSGTLTPAIRIWNSGNSNKNISANFGARSFAYSAPSGYKALCTTNLPTPTIADGSTAFGALTYSGNGNARTLTGLNMNPDFIWIKSRSTAQKHVLVDSVRTTSTGEYLASNSTQAEGTGVHISGTTDGITIADPNASTIWYNDSSHTYVAWAWDAGSSTVSNTDGTITTNLRANATAGFSIATYSGSGSSGDTLGHGLNAEPEFVIVKARTKIDDFRVYHKGAGTGYYLRLNSDHAKTSGGNWQSVSSTTLALDSDSAVNSSSHTYVAYFFAPVAGYSAFGSYTGTGAGSTGPFNYCGFRPALVAVKRTDSSGWWSVWDTKRDLDNPAGKNVWWNDTYYEIDSSQYRIDILSNGFRMRSGHAERNASGGTYVWLAFAENPFQANGGLAR